MHYVLRHAQNQPREPGICGGQNKLPLGSLNRWLISYLSAGITFAIKLRNKLEQSVKFGPNEPLEGVAGPETGHKTSFSSKMTRVLSIGIIKRS